MGIAIKLYSLIYKLYFSFRYGQRLYGIIYRNSFKGVKGNHVLIKGDFAKSKIIFEGKGNVLNIEGRFDSGYIRIIGNNNRLIIEPGCMIPKITILFRGNNQEILIKQNTYMRTRCKIVSHGDGNYIHIGRNCVFSDDVNIWNSDTHQIMDTTGKTINPSKPTIIEDHVWIGRNTSLTKGAHIGRNSVIGMVSVVTGYIPENTIAAGIPAKVIKKNIKWSSEFVQETNLLPNDCNYAIYK